MLTTDEANTETIWKRRSSRRTCVRAARHPRARSRWFDWQTRSVDVTDLCVDSMGGSWGKKPLVQYLVHR